MANDCLFKSEKAEGLGLGVQSICGQMQIYFQIWEEEGNKHVSMTQFALDKAKNIEFENIFLEQLLDHL